MRILYVEDNQYLADAVNHLLTKAKINVDWVDDGEKGLELALKPIYDVVVLDVMLPKLSGLDILRTMRDRGVKTPVIILSALSQVEDKVRGLQVGADDYQGSRSGGWRWKRCQPHDCIRLEEGLLCRAQYRCAGTSALKRPDENRDRQGADRWSRSRWRSGNRREGCYRVQG